MTSPTTPEADKEIEVVMAGQANLLDSARALKQVICGKGNPEQDQSSFCR